MGCLDQGHRRVHRVRWPAHTVNDFTVLAMRRNWLATGQVIPLGQGYATEAARAALQVGFERLALQEIVSFTAVRNRRSRAVMERLHMVRDEETFDHPDVPGESGLREHCLYRISRKNWRKGRNEKRDPKSVYPESLE